jgi:NADH dehydrogenase [ubiquinone] 1 alpha subcomplex assembly factor 5
MSALPSAVPPLLFDRSHQRRVRARRRPGFAPHAFLYDEACSRVAERLAEINRTFPWAVTLEDREGRLATALRAVPSVERCYASDSTGANLDGEATAAWCADAEALPLAEGQQPLLASAFCLQTLNDVPGHLVQVRRALRPDGLYLAVFPGGDTLHELRDCMQAAELQLTEGISSRFAPLIDVRAAGALLQRAGFALPVVDRDRLTLTYGSLAALVAELRGLALTGSLHQRPRRIPPCALFSLAEALYRERYGTPDGRLPVTVELIHLMGWSPHQSQQQPARRGSGSVGLGAAVAAHRHSVR